MTQKILVTSALLYANGPLHFGHLVGAYLPADCYVRAMRLLGYDVHFISGSDEYGVAITMSAEKEGRTPKEHVDLYHTINKELFKKLQIDFDHYGRTTCKEHEAPVQAFFKDLLENGYIEEWDSEQLYSEKENRFLADRYVVGTCPKCGFDEARGDECTSCGASYEATDLLKPRSKMTDSPLILKKTRHWYLLLDKMKERLIEMVKERNWKPNVVNFVMRYIEDLRARSITRDSKWGIPVPLSHAEGKVLYVWFDAPIGYLSASMEWSKEKWKDYWLDPKTKLVHFIGKDNIPFHAAIFPAMCMGQNLPIKLVDELPANEFLNLEGKKFSKSDGWTIDLNDFLTRYTADQIRYALAANAPETSDSEFLFKDFQNRCNGDLVGKFGNFVNRTLTFILKKEITPKNHQTDQLFMDKIRSITNEVAESYKTFKLRRATHLIMELAQAGNVYFDQNKPWKIEDKETLETVLYHCLECIKLLALVSSPVIPEAALKIWTLIGYKAPITDWESTLNTPFPEGQSINTPELLFNKVEDSMIQEELTKLQTSIKPGKSFEPLKEVITFDQVNQIDLRVGKVLSAEKVPKSSKLLLLQVDIGLETRQIVSGIAKSYSPESLIGKNVVVVANLKPAKLMGIESQGMIIAGGEKTLELPMLQTLTPGDSVH
ncbi:methionine--tRNA ligase [Chlamydiales bacterium]|nr:methionine--tRNA ligase [Chlamydiales bacterium]